MFHIQTFRTPDNIFTKTYLWFKLLKAVSNRKIGNGPINTAVGRSHGLVERLDISQREVLFGLMGRWKHLL